MHLKSFPAKRLRFRMHPARFMPVTDQLIPDWSNSKVLNGCAMTA